MFNGVDGIEFFQAELERKANGIKKRSRIAEKRKL